MLNADDTVPVTTLLPAVVVRVPVAFDWKASADGQTLILSEFPKSPGHLATTAPYPVVPASVSKVASWWVSFLTSTPNEVTVFPGSTVLDNAAETVNTVLLVIAETVASSYVPASVIVSSR